MIDYENICGQTCNCKTEEECQFSNSKPSPPMTPTSEERTMKNADKPAYPPGNPIVIGNGGLTKREVFVMAAMQGILANEELRVKMLHDMDIDGTTHDNYVAVWALKHADSLLSLLEESKPLNS